MPLLAPASATEQGCILLAKFLRSLQVDAYVLLSVRLLPSTRCAIVWLQYKFVPGLPSGCVYEHAESMSMARSPAAEVVSRVSVSLADISMHVLGVQGKVEWDGCGSEGAQ